MKRQRVVSQFFAKKPKSDSVVSELDPTQSQQVEAIQPEEGSTSSAEIVEVQHGRSSNIKDNLPECWTEGQYTSFKGKHEWLEVSNKKLGCTYCSNYSHLIKEKGIHFSKEWAGFQVVGNGKDKQGSLRKKFWEHSKSKAHDLCKENYKTREQEHLTKAIDKLNEKHLSTTCRVFNSVYSLAKRCRPFSDIEDEIELQIKNGLDMGVALHSRQTAATIVDFIAKEIIKEIFTKVAENSLKICLIIDEASTISCKPVIIIFVKVEDSVSSPMIFVELVELEKQDAETICFAVMNSLQNVGLTKDYLKKHLIGFCSDGASVMLGRKSGVSTRIAKDFPNIIIWHCLNHRLQLVLDDSVKDIKQINHFKIFLDKIFTIFHQSNKNQIELTSISEDLGLEIIKIGRVLGPRWAACSFRSAMAVWRAYPALHQYFSSNPKYSGMAARLENIHFMTDLALMIDILQELDVLSRGLQARDVHIITAEKLVRRSIAAFQMLVKEKGTYEKKVTELITSETYKNIEFVENERFIRLPRERLLESIIANLEKRLMDCGHLRASGSQSQASTKLQFLKFLEPEYWNIEEVVVPWKAAEEQLLAFTEFFNCQIDINEYRDFLEGVLRNPHNYSIPTSIQKAKNVVRTIAVSSAEAERGFSKMNLICSEKRSRLTVSNITDY
ncbi:hypothetical protein lerEdw1_001879 [Lerista edwardsae]|nr:hypothetical protein lerEdw1_001879 [Lerista edwardsae]